MSDSSILRLVFDGVWNVGETVFNSFKKEEKQEPLDEFFRIISLCNKNLEYPKLISIREIENKIVYEVKCPRGIGKNDFEKHRNALEIDLGKEIEIDWGKGVIYISHEI